MERFMFGAKAGPVQPTIDSVFKQPPRKLNDDVYEIHSGSDNPSVEIVFFHGFEMEESSDAYWQDWLSGDRSHCWLGSWLAQDFPEARILSVRYDSSLTHSPNWGRMNLCGVANNLANTLVKFAGRVGQRECPVILVGHSVGGLVMKKLLVTVDSLSTNYLEQSDGSAFELFLNKVRGFFFYATPHIGSRLGQDIIGNSASTGPFLKTLEVSSAETASLHEDFMRLRSIYKWRLYGVGELWETKLFSKLGRCFFHGIVVEEASASQGLNRNFTMIETDHISICKPDEKTSLSFLCLSRFLEDIIHQEKTCGQQCQGLPDHPVGLDDQAFKLIQKMKSWGAGKGGVVGLVGMGGIGKTTLARRAFNEISKEFEYTCFLNNVKGIPSYDLEGKILEKFHCNGNKLGKISWNDLERTTVLLVMDDVDSVDQFKLLPSRFRESRRGSLLIFTSRGDPHMMAKYVNCFEVKFLKEDAARRLFCRHAFDSDDIPEKLQPALQAKVKRVVEKCDGLPLSLEVMGGYLCGHNENVEIWEGAIDDLEQAQSIGGGENDSLFAKLQISYHALASEEKEMFVDIANYFFGQRLDVALAAWSTSFRNPQNRWSNLMRRCLVKSITKVDWYSDSEEYQEVWMHEHLRDVGKKLSTTTYLSSSEGHAKNIVQEINSNRTKQLRSLHCSYSDEVLQFNSSASLAKLKYLALRGVPLHENPLGGFFRKLLAKLKYLALRGVPLHENPLRRGFPRNLALLQWNSPSQFRHPEFSMSLHDMDKLAVLELENWKYSVGLMEGLGNHTNLQVLTLRSSSRYHLPESVGSLTQLRRLTLGGEVVGLPEAIGNLSSLEYLGFRFCYSFAHLPNSFGSLSSLATLIFIKCKKLNRLPDSFGSLSSLKTLKFNQCDELRSLPDSFGTHLASLQSLAIERCPQLKHLPPTFSNLSGLQTLICKGTVEVSKDTFCNSLMFQNLKFVALDLKLRNSNPPPSFSHLSCKAVRILDFTMEQDACDDFGNSENSGELRHVGKSRDMRDSKDSSDDGPGGLWEGDWELSSLEKLTSQGEELTAFGKSLGRRVSGDKLRLIFSQGTASSDCTDCQVSLIVLKVRRGSGVQSLPESIGHLTLLQRLIIGGSDLEELPEAIGELTSLPYLKFRDMKLLKRMPDSLGRLSALKELEIKSCDQLETLPEEMGNLFSLQKMSLWGCGQLQTLPNSLGRLSALEKLYISWCDQLETLPEEIGNLFSLQRMTLGHCGRLQTLPNSLGRLSALEELELEFCDRLETLPEEMGNLFSLQRMTLGHCGRLHTVPRNWGRVAAAVPSSQKSDKGQVQRSPNHASGSSSSSSRKKLTLQVKDCPLLNDFLENLGWDSISQLRRNGWKINEVQEPN